MLFLRSLVFWSNRNAREIAKIRFGFSAQAATGAALEADLVLAPSKRVAARLRT